MKAFPFDAKNPLGGDHEFYVGDHGVDYNVGDHGIGYAGESFEELRDKVNEARWAEFEGQHRDFEIAHSTKIVGFWIVADEVYETALLVWPEDGCRNDGMVYACNAMAKRILQAKAIKTLTIAGN